LFLAIIVHILWNLFSLKKQGGKKMGNLEKEYPILREDRRRKESKNKNIKSLIFLGVGIGGILLKFLFYN
jgi:hypothetical protein